MHRYRTSRGPGPWERGGEPEDYRERERRWAEDRERSYMDEVGRERTDRTHVSDHDDYLYGSGRRGGGRNW
ncbi:MAG TPA: hypothetical protein VMS56_15370 [Thermoanaerobaculia bacterium]|nr:hypothetical protein [Thermoanaerobaculia bacterium]